MKNVESKKDIFSRLINASVLLSSTLELEEILPQAMEVMRGLMNCEAASIMLLDDKSKELTFEVVLGEKEGVLKKRRLSLGRGIAGIVALRGEPIIVNDAYSDTRFDKSFDEYTGFKTRSILCVPLKVQERVIGVAQVINPLSKKGFTREDLYIFSIFANQVSLVIDSARLHKDILDQKRLEDELKFAKSIQDSFLPSSFPESPRFSIYGISKPARKVGGDFYDVFKIDDSRIALVIGDVSGKGIAAAIFMARIMSEIRFFSQHSKYAHSPSLILEAINHSLFERFSSGIFVTVIYAVFDSLSNKITLANAGHINPIIFSSRQEKAKFLEDKCKGFPLGVDIGERYLSQEFYLERGDCFLLFTDGLLEARNYQGEFFSHPSLLTSESYLYPQAVNIVEEFVGEVEKFAEGVAQADDLTILALKVG